MTLFTDVTEQVLARSDELSNQADIWGADTASRMDALAAEASAKLGILDNESYIPDFSGLDLGYNGPGGTQPEYETAPDYSSEGPADLTMTDGDTLSEDPAATTAFSFTEGTYVPILKTEIGAALTSVLGGNLLLPTAVVTAMYDRVVLEFGREQVAAEWAASDNGASKGWELPAIATLARIVKAEDQSSKRLSAALLESYIQEWVNKQTDMWNAVKEGTTFEGMWIDDYHKLQDRSLEAAKATVDKAISINDDVIKRDDLKLRKYASEWAAFGEQIRAEVARMQADIASVRLVIDSEQARHLYESSIVAKGTKVEDGETGLAIERAKLVVENSLGTLTQLASLTANVAMALMAASDVSLGTGTSMASDEYQNHTYQEQCC